MAEVLLVLVIVAILYGALGPKTPRGYQGGRVRRPGVNVLPSHDLKREQVPPSAFSPDERKPHD